MPWLAVSSAGLALKQLIAATLQSTTVDHAQSAASDRTLSGRSIALGQQEQSLGHVDAQGRTFAVATQGGLAAGQVEGSAWSLAGSAGSLLASGSGTAIEPGSVPAVINANGPSLPTLLPLPGTTELIRRTRGEVSDARVSGQRVNLDSPSPVSAAQIGVSGMTPTASQTPIAIGNPQTQSITHSPGKPVKVAPVKAHNYLIETNPELTNLRQFLGSDYLLGNLGYTPDNTQKRLGDGLYEQRLIREAVVARTGQRFLAGLTSDEAMFRYLMDNAIAYKDSLNLSLGVTLTAEQVAALTHDIVWLEEYEVNGEKVLVPVLYLAQAKGRLTPNGALIQGQNLSLITGGDLDSAGTLRASNDLDAVAGGSIGNGGLMEAGNRLDLLAGDSIRNALGGIISGRDLGLNALSGDVINERSVTRHEVNAGGRHIIQDFVDSAARIEAANSLSFSAGRDVANIGGVFDSRGDLGMTAGRDVTIASAQERSLNEYGRNNRISRTLQHAAEVGAGRDIEIIASRDFTASDGRIDAYNNITLAAGRDMTLASAANESHLYSKTKSGSKKVTRQEDHVHQQATEVSANGDVTLSANSNMVLSASRVTAGGEAYLVAGEQMALLAAEDLDYSLYDMKKKGSWGSKKTQRDEVTSVRNVGSEIATGGDLTLLSGGDQTYQRAHLESGADLTLKSGGEIAFEGVKDLKQESHEKSDSGFVWTSAKGKGNTDETLRQSVLLAQGEVVIKAVDGLKIDIKQLNKQSVTQTIEAMVKADPQLAWLKEAELRGDVDWRRVKETHESFKYSNSGLGGGAALVIAIIVTYLTWGAGTAIAGSVSGAATTAGASATTASFAGAAAQAGFHAVVNNAAISTINNRGDLGAVAKDITSSDSLKGYAVSAISGGMTGGAGGSLTAGDLGMRLAVNSALNTVVNGGSFKDNLLQAGVDLAASYLTGAIYEKVGNGLVGTGLPTQVAVHAIVGGLIGAAAGGDFRTAALAAGANEALLGLVGDSIFPGEAHEHVIAMTGQLIGMTVAAAAGGSDKDQEVAGWVTQQATVYNYLNHEEVDKLADELIGCRTVGDPTACRTQIKQNYQTLSDGKTGANLYDCTQRGEAACNAQLAAAEQGSFALDKLLDLVVFSTEEKEILESFQDINHADERVAYEPWRQTFWQESGAAGGVLLAGAAAAATVEKAIAARAGTTGAKGTVSLEKEAGTYFGQQRKYWSQEPIQYNGNKVYQRNDLIDPGRVDSQTGLTNKQLMENGLAPYGTDGKKVNLHHMLQTQDGPIAEVTQSFHQKNTAVIHINSGSNIPSGINRAQFEKWKKDYWKTRASDF